MLGLENQEEKKTETSHFQVFFCLITENNGMRRDKLIEEDENITDRLEKRSKNSVKNRKNLTNSVNPFHVK